MSDPIELPAGLPVHQLHAAVGPSADPCGRLRQRAKARPLLGRVRGQAARSRRGYHALPATGQGEELCPGRGSGQQGRLHEGRLFPFFRDTEKSFNYWKVLISGRIMITQGIC